MCPMREVHREGKLGIMASKRVGLGFFGKKSVNGNLKGYIGKWDGISIAIMVRVGIFCNNKRLSMEFCIYKTWE